MRGYAELSAAGDISLAVGGRQHHNRCAGQPRLLLDRFGKGKAIHDRHHRVEQNKRERPALFACLAHDFERLVPAGNGRGLDVPAAQHLFENPTIGGIVVDDEDRQFTPVQKVQRRPARHRPLASRSER